MRALWYRESSFLGNWLALLAVFAMIPFQLLFDSMNASSPTWITDSFTGVPLLPIVAVFMLFRTTVVDKEQGVFAVYLCSGKGLPSYVNGKVSMYVAVGAAQWIAFVLCHLNGNPANDALLWTWDMAVSLLLLLVQIMLTGQIIVYVTVMWRDVRASAAVGVFILVAFPFIVLQAMVLPRVVTLMIIAVLLTGDLAAMRMLGARACRDTAGPMRR